MFPSRKSGMRRSHAAALALVVWYLLFPPTSHKHPSGDVSAPISQWQRRRISRYRKNEFPSKEECESRLARLVKQIDPKQQAKTVAFYKQGQCIASDDPRLKKKK